MARDIPAECADVAAQQRWDEASLRILGDDVAPCMRRPARPESRRCTLAEQPWGLREFIVRDPPGLDVRFCEP